ncbi:MULTISPECIES: hypothetical protein [Hansschlegelia]|uniref:Uncharacterized protein n=1 Tax=Hansschlegelia zhihuaiae TaxID=405005 RepID=A0A4Q0MEC9_9HYPH|nr:hypothetical protein [Hansschlegelia zhihuaiae]RXF71513.1 hypothetical protein EK403_15740 [Hansschlegelia zhihuaiae]
MVGGLTRRPRKGTSPHGRERAADKVAAQLRRRMIAQVKTDRLCVRVARLQRQKAARRQPNPLDHARSKLTRLENDQPRGAEPKHRSFDKSLRGCARRIGAIEGLVGQHVDFNVDRHRKRRPESDKQRRRDVGEQVDIVRHRMLSATVRAQDRADAATCRRSWKDAFNSRSTGSGR